MSIALKFSSGKFQPYPAFPRPSSRAPKKLLTPVRLSDNTSQNYLLPLLPSGPDGIQEPRARQTQLSTLKNFSESPERLTSEKRTSPAKADCRYRAPLAPRLGMAYSNSECRVKNAE